MIDRAVSSTVQVDLGEYERLVARDQELTALEVAGVDDWDKYGEALATLNSEKDDE